MAERIPDSVLQQADEVVNIDLTADELITRLTKGKKKKAVPDKIEIALKNFFKVKNLTAPWTGLKEVASQVERKIETEFNAIQP